MREIVDTNELRSIEMGIMDAIHAFCTENHLRYTLFYGSLLGAIRHNGFIPWDDDMDICMPREDYDYFCRHFDCENYGIYACETNRDYPYPFAKAFDKRTVKKEPIHTYHHFEIGVDVDVFPVDEIGDFHLTEKSAKIRLKLIQKWFFCALDETKGKAKAWVKRALLTCIRKPNYYAVRLNADAVRLSACKKEPISYVCYYVPGWSRPLVMSENLFENLVPHRFEDREYMITTKYDYALTTDYGDYMTPPPVEKRVTTHSFRAYRKN